MLSDMHNYLCLSRYHPRKEDIGLVRQLQLNNMAKSIRSIGGYTKSSHDVSNLAFPAPILGCKKTPCFYCESFTVAPNGRPRLKALSKGN